MRRKIIRIIIGIGILLFSTSCGSSIKRNAQDSSNVYLDDSSHLITIESFNIIGDSMETPYNQWFYIDWINNIEGKTIDRINLKIVGRFLTNDFFYGLKTLADYPVIEKTFHLLEPQGVRKSEHNRGELQECTYLFAESEPYTVKISEIYFTDGSMLEGDGLSNIVTTSMWANKGEEPIPVKLNEACFWNWSEDFSSLVFHIDWTNQSKNINVFGVIYKIVGKNSDGTIVEDENAQEAVVYYTAIEQESIATGESNQNYTGYLYAYAEDWIRWVRIVDVSIVRVIDTTGLVWDIPENERTITCIVSGKKGYFFSDEDNYPFVNALIEKFDTCLHQIGIDCKSPLVYVRDGEYCVLRYEDFDVRVELTKENAIKSDKISIISYNDIRYGTENERDDMEKVVEKNGQLRLALFPIVLTEIDPEESIEKISDYNNNKRGYIDFTDQSYDTFEDVGNILNEKKEKLLIWISSVGRDLYYPLSELLWAKKPVYEEYQNKTVEHRPTWNYDDTVIEVSDGMLPQLPNFAYKKDDRILSINIDSDGAFQGRYEYTIRSGADHGKVFRNSFTGSFNNIHRKDSFTFEMTLEKIYYEKNRSDEYFEEGDNLVTYDIPWELSEEGASYVLYLPGADTSIMSDSLLSTLQPGIGVSTDDIPDRLPIYALTNVRLGIGFYESSQSWNQLTETYDSFYLPVLQGKLLLTIEEVFNTYNKNELHNWVEEYHDVLEKIVENEKNTDNIVQFVFIDEDDIPEMAVYSDTGRTYTLYSYKSDCAQIIRNNSPYYDVLFAVSKKNKCVNIFSKGRWREDTECSIEDGEIAVIEHGRADMHEGNGAFMWDGSIVTEYEYEKKVKALFDGERPDIAVGYCRKKDDIDNVEFWLINDAIDLLT